ncbi:low molecular weight phosphatase family protein [Saliphagus infecundisoli]|uniref:Low molecular weight phosphatase family protein n=1 Tax=Saliphagus infecundisoli TaxID=1849069 RepID=A0ABD5QCH3_9EURY|nr:low molecular weight phosphatase family protein [Saliphagus infecundisoli]
MTDERLRVAFVCVRNAGRSQMATAFAERERRERGLEEEVKLLTGGTRPAEHVHDVVVEAMAEEGIDLEGRTPREITTAELESCTYVATMGCSTLELDAAAVEVRDWALDDPGEEGLETVREIRAEIRGRVHDLFDEIEAEVDGPA